MSGLTYEQLNPKEDNVKALLDEPAQKYLKSTTIVEMMKRSYNYIFAQIDINVGNQLNVLDAIYAMSAWMAFGAYVNSISAELQLQDPAAIRAVLNHYKEVAAQFAGIVGVNIEKEFKTVIDDPLPYINYGGSLLDKKVTDVSD